MTLAEQCKQIVVDSTGWHRSRCENKAKENGYCKIHSPEYIAWKEQKQKERYDSKCCKKCKWLLKDYFTYCPNCGTKKEVSNG